jgi:cobalt-zinc-cadmium efflux system membrane fusion protein
MIRTTFVEALVCAVLAAVLTGCNNKVKADASAEAPPPAKVEHELDANFVKVDHPEEFPVVTAGKYLAALELNVTGVVNPDVSRNVPAISLATGRVIEVDARLGDEVKKGQRLLRVQSSDISGAFSDYRKAVKNEQLARMQLDRAKLLYDDGAIPRSALEIAQVNEDNAKVDLETTEQKLKVLGSDPQHPDGVVDVYAPVSGVITDQQVTAGGGVQALSAPNPFTISDLSHVWIVCDVYENDQPFVRIGEFADIHLNAYPNRVFRARISNIAPILDPNIRTAKVRLEVENPGLLRIGMFVTATFHGQSRAVHAAVPASAVLHLHDRDWVYVPAGDAHFRRVEVNAGTMLPGNQQEIVSGIDPGQRVVSNALVMQSTVEQ